MEDLSECMERHAELYFPRKNGQCHFDHCLAIETTTGEWPQDFPVPEIPEGGEDVWNWYWDLRKRAGSGFSGPEPLKYTEIDAWIRLNQLELTLMELDLIKYLDDDFITNYHKVTKKG